MPLIIKKNFRPDGWLGLLLGSKLWISFSNPTTLESDLENLLKHLRSGVDNNSAGPVVPRQEPYGVKHEHHHKNHAAEYFFGNIPVGHDQSSVITTSPRNLGRGHGSITSSWMEIDLDQKNTVVSWNHQQVSEWLDKNELTDLIIETELVKLTGYHLIMFYQLRFECPKIYYDSFRRQLGFESFVDFLKFTHHLQTLLEGS